MVWPDDAGLPVKQEWVPQAHIMYLSKEKTIIGD